MKFSDNQPKNKKVKAKQTKAKATAAPKFVEEDSIQSDAFCLFGQAYQQDEDAQLFAYSSR